MGIVGLGRKRERFDDEFEVCGDRNAMYDANRAPILELNLVVLTGQRRTAASRPAGVVVSGLDSGRICVCPLGRIRDMGLENMGVHTLQKPHPLKQSTVRPDKCGETERKDK